MKDIEAQLEDQFSFFDLHKSRLKCLCRLVFALLETRTVNLSRLSLCFSTEVKLESSYRRIQRFFSQLTFPFDQLSLFIWNHFQGEESGALALDRTNWKFGKTHINILMLSLCFDGYSVPLMWKVLRDKRGNSSQEERILLLQRFVSIIKPDHIPLLLADRELIVLK